MKWYQALGISLTLAFPGCGDSKSFFYTTETDEVLKEKIATACLDQKIDEEIFTAEIKMYAERITGQEEDYLKAKFINSLSGPTVEICYRGNGWTEELKKDTSKKIVENLKTKDYKNNQANFAIGEFDWKCALYTDMYEINAEPWTRKSIRDAEKKLSKEFSVDFHGPFYKFRIDFEEDLAEWRVKYDSEQMKFPKGDQ